MTWSKGGWRFAFAGVMFLAMSGWCSEVITVDLGGTDWSVSEAGKGDWFPAEVPGCVHTDLLAAGRIEDPLYRDNEVRLLWIGDTSWVYRRTFQVPAELLEREHILLRFEGLDTLATVRLNGKELGYVDNMFRTWEFSVKEILTSDVNSIEVVFDAVPPIIAAKEKARPIAPWKYPGSAYIRKMSCNFGWDWGPTVVTCGIWRPVSLVAFDTARLDHVLILQDHSRDGEVQLNVQAEAFPLALRVPIEFHVQVFGPDGEVVAEGRADYAPFREPRAAPTEGRAARGVELSIPDPKLWWPVGMGDQPLYRVRTEMIDQNGVVLDVDEKRIGLRTIESVFPNKEQMRHFKVNGVPFFAKGANLIPPDPFLNRITDEMRQRLVDDAVAANMNMLRVWGGGYYLENEFYDLCDEVGLLVWQDFIFACAHYPGWDVLFRENVRQEARDNIRRLRHHASLAIWCGGNEVHFTPGSYEWINGVMSEIDYNALFYDTLGEAVWLFDPQTTYVHGSPGQGAVHSWQVWHGDQPFERLLYLSGMVSEFGFQSYPEPQTVETYTAPEDRTDLRSPVMEHHQRSGRMYLGRPEPTGDRAGAERIRHQSRHYFGEAQSFNDSLWLSQITQAHGIEMICKRMRQNWPRATGVLYWQYNDMWGGPTWSSVDYLGRWKALHYRARRFFSPVMVGGFVSGEKVGIWFVNDRLRDLRGTFEWRLTTAQGEQLASARSNVTIAASGSQHEMDIDVAQYLEAHGAENLMLWLRLLVEGEIVPEDLVIFTEPGRIKLSDEKLAYTLEGSGTEWFVTVSARKPALWVWLEVENAMVTYSDNFFHLSGRDDRVIRIELDEPRSREEMMETLRVRSLMDIERGPVIESVPPSVRS